MSAADLIRVRPNGPLHGEVRVGGAKNSVLKLIAASLLADGEYTLTNVARIADVATMCELLAALGVQSEVLDGDGTTLRLVNNGEIVPEAPYELVERIRASTAVLGPLLARCGSAKLSMPGGDDFGSRPIDMHIKALEAMGATFELRHGVLEANAPGLRGADITLPFPSVGATENILMAAVYAKGTTRLDNAAREPEIVDLCRLLQSMGADIEGVGLSTVIVHGQEFGSLRPVHHDVVTDRLQVATYFAAVGVAGGEVFVRGARAEHMEMLLDRMTAMGMRFTSRHDGVLAERHGRLTACDVATLPYPGVGTDYKPLIVTMLVVADGVGIVTENLYPGRFRYVDELLRLGADVRTSGHHAVIRGVEGLSGAPVRAADIRAGATLVLAGLVAEGETVISDVHHIDRGYDDLVGHLSALGADITRL